jgi:hypothetical protein
VQAETTRMMVRRSSSDAISWDRSVMQPPPWRAYMGSADALLIGSISDVAENGFVR